MQFVLGLVYINNVQGKGRSRLKREPPLVSVLIRFLESSKAKPSYSLFRFRFQVLQYCSKTLVCQVRSYLLVTYLCVKFPHLPKRLQHKTIVYACVYVMYIHNSFVLQNLMEMYILLHLSTYVIFHLGICRL